MTLSPELDELLRRARAPLGPRTAVTLETPDGALGELARLLNHTNGFTVFNAGVQVFHAGAGGLGPELIEWNDAATWKDTYQGLADGLFCFGQDLFGVQFAVEKATGNVVSFDPELGTRTVLGRSLDDWARWLLEDPDVNGAYGLATRWQDEHRALEHDERLVPLQFFVLGGGYDDDNLKPEQSVTAMRARGPIARQLHDLPDGTKIRFDVK
jgi:hypothetical protein